jgi:hypothetical protein
VQHVGKSKIGRLRAKNIDYPQLRLPQQYSSTIGDVAGVFETAHEGKQALLIVTEHSVSNEDIVLKPSEEILKPRGATAAESRLSALESEISDLKSLLLLKESYSLHENRKEKAEGEIRTRVVASTGLHQKTPESLKA